MISPRRTALLVALTLVVALFTGCERAPQSVPPGGNRPDVIVILIDALRADRLGCYGHSNDTSPELDTFIERGIRFTDAYSQSSHTKISVASLFTGLIPPSHGVREAAKPFKISKDRTRIRSDVLPPDALTVADLFRSQGYATAAVITNPHLVPGMGFDQGFDTYVHLPAKTRASLVNERAMQLLTRDIEKPMFLYIHYMDVHAPYDPPASHADLFTAGLVETEIIWKNGPHPQPVPAEQVAYTSAIYDAQIRYWDDEFAAFMGELEAYGCLDNCLVVITADHGEEFYEHEGFGHGVTCYQEMLHVPLALVWPGVIPAGIERLDIARLIDLLPTLAHLTASELPDVHQQGRDLFADGWGPGPSGAETRHPEPVSVYAETHLGKVPRSLRLGDKKIIHNQADDTFELYDLADDPLELSALDPGTSPGGQEIAASLKESMNLPLAVRQVQDAELDSTTVRDLKSLGYLQ